jgi:hypothetical protein
MPVCCATYEPIFVGSFGQAFRRIEESKFFATEGVTIMLLQTLVVIALIALVTELAFITWILLCGGWL